MKKQKTHRLPTAQNPAMLARQIKNLEAEGFAISLLSCPKCKLIYRTATHPEDLEIKCPSCRHKFTIVENKTNE